MTMQCVCSDGFEIETNNKVFNRIHTAPLNSLFASFLSRIANYFEEKQQRRIDRDAFDQLLALDDEMLADIGITRDDVKWASKLPISVNASQALEEAKRFGRI